MYSKEFKKKYIKENYNKLSQTTIKKELHISYETLIKIAKELNIYTPRKQLLYTEDEKREYIKNNYNKLSNKEIMKELHISSERLRKLAKELNVYVVKRRSPYTDAEIREYIKNNYNKLSQQKIMKELKISNNTLNKIVHELDLYVKKEKFVMTDKNIEFIKQNYKKLGLKKTSEILKCNQSTVSKYAKELSLTTEKYNWSKEEDDFFKLYWNEYKPMAFVRKFNNKFKTKKTLNTLRNHAKKLKITTDITSSGNYLNTYDVLSVLGFTYSKTQALCSRGYIEYDIYKSKKRISYDNLKKFLKKYPHLWNCSVADMTFIKSICTDVSIREKGDIYTIEPWLLDKIEQDETNKAIVKM